MFMMIGLAMFTMIVDLFLFLIHFVWKDWIRIAPWRLWVCVLVVAVIQIAVIQIANFWNEARPVRDM